MNKLDEILESYLYDDNGWQVNGIEEAKQAILEWVNDEIIGDGYYEMEHKDYRPGFSGRLRTTDTNRQDVIKQQRAKLIALGLKADNQEKC